MAKILIVEDDKDLINAYSMILKNNKHEVVESYDGKDALKALESFQPDLILLDLLMPVMGGLEFLKNYNKINDNANTKILIFTNMENSPEVKEAYSLGANRCIIKAWTAPQNLNKVVTDVLADHNVAASNK